MLDFLAHVREPSLYAVVPVAHAAGRRTVRAGLRELRMVQAVGDPRREVVGSGDVRRDVAGFGEVEPGEAPRPVRVVEVRLRVEVRVVVFVFN